MMNIVVLPPSQSYNPDDLTELCRKGGKRNCPDAGGTEAEFVKEMNSSE